MTIGVEDTESFIRMSNRTPSKSNKRFRNRFVRGRDLRGGAVEQASSF
jgi:hypothetical protein